MRMGTQMRSAGLFIGCFLIATYGIGIAGRLWLPPPDVGELTEKVQALDRDAPDVDTVTIGSSRVLHTFDPQLFDLTALATGCPMRSYNLGIGGLNLIEMRYVLRRLESGRPPHMKRVLFDPPNDIHIQFENLKSERVWVTTDPREAPLAVADILSHPDPRKYSSLLRYLVAFAYHNSSLGFVSRYLRAAPAAQDGEGSGRRGYLPLDPADAPTVERTSLLRQRDKFIRLARDLHDEAAEQAPAAVLDSEQLQQRVDVILRTTDLIRSFGYEPVLLSLPDTYGESITDARFLEAALRRPERAIPVVNFMGKADAGIIYDPASWYDWGHVTDATARYVSTEAARRLCLQSGRALAATGTE
jgi:hypothetical protein